MLERDCHVLRGWRKQNQDQRMDFQGCMFSLSERKSLVLTSTDQDWDRAASGSREWGQGEYGGVLLVEVFCRKFRT